MAFAHAVGYMGHEHPDLAHHDSPVHELGNIFQRLANHGDREWLEEILQLARKRLATIESEQPDGWRGDPHAEH